MVIKKEKIISLVKEGEWKRKEEKEKQDEKKCKVGRKKE